MTRCFDAPRELVYQACTQSKHLKVLQHAGLISQGRRAQWRPCRLEPERLKEAADWIATYRHIWDERFDRLDEYLRELQQRSPEPEQPPTREADA